MIKGGIRLLLLSESTRCCSGIAPTAVSLASDQLELLVSASAPPDSCMAFVMGICDAIMKDNRVLVASLRCSSSRSLRWRPHCNGSARSAVVDSLAICGSA